MDNEYKDRLISRINKSYVEYGKNRLFLIGNNLNDLYLRNLREGAYSINLNLQNYALNNDFKYYIKLDKKNILEIYKLENNDFVKIELSQYLENNNKKAMSFAFKNVENTKQDSENNNQKVEEEIIDKNFETIISILVNKPDKGKTLFFIDEFDWLSNIYKDANSDYIRRIKEMEKIKNHLVLISSLELTKLKNDFYLEFDDKEIIELGKPSKDEIIKILYRISWRKLNCNIPDFDYEYIANQFSNSKYTLRECVKVFQSKILEHGIKLNHLEHFKFETKVKEKVEWKDIILDDNIKKSIIATIKQFLVEEEPTRKGMVLTGPPGTGKTLIAKAIANEANMFFLAPKLSELKGEYVGQSAPKIKSLFEEARLNQPTLIFMDEIDTLFPSRDSKTDGDSYTIDITNEFLQQIDGVDTGTQKIFVLAATNRIEQIDSAVRSRLGNEITIGLPNEDSRIELFKFNLKKIINEDFWNNNPELITFIKNRSEGMSGRDIKNACSTISKDIVGMERTNYKKYIISYFTNYKNVLLEEFGRKTGINCILPHNIKVKEMYGVEKVMESMTEIIKQRENAVKDYINNNNLSLRNGILLYGPPGNGKTKLVEYLAHKTNSILITVESKDVQGYNIRETFMNLDDIFNNSLKLSKLTEDDKESVILFFDEFDSIASIDINAAVRGTLLRKLADDNGIRNINSKLFLIAATNFYERIDEASKRRGRFDLHLHIPNPKEESATQLLEAQLLSIEGIDKNNVKNISKKLYKGILERKFQEKLKMELYRLDINYQLSDDTEKIVNKKLRKRVYEYNPSASDLMETINTIKVKISINIEKNVNKVIEEFIQKEYIDE